MTPEERAERIIKNQPIIHFWDDPLTVNEPSLKDLVVSAIRAAMEDAYARALESFRSTGLPIALAQGKAEAYEDAAKIAEECDESDWEYVAKRIRARAKALEEAPTVDGTYGAGESHSISPGEWKADGDAEAGQ